MEKNERVTYCDMENVVKELMISNPWRMDAIFKNDSVPSSNDSSIPSLLFTKSMSAIDAATVPEIFNGKSKFLL